MKAAPFAFVRAESLGHALEQLARHGGGAKPIAGGQSLVPMMAMRLARPAVLVDERHRREPQLLDREPIRPGGGGAREQEKEEGRTDHGPTSTTGVARSAKPGGRRSGWIA